MNELKMNFEGVQSFYESLAVNNGCEKRGAESSNLCASVFSPPTTLFLSSRFVSLSLSLSIRSFIRAFVHSVRSVIRLHSLALISFTAFKSHFKGMKKSCVC